MSGEEKINQADWLVHSWCVLIASCLLSSCGAPLKSADEVGDQFGASLPLGDKMSLLCQKLMAETDGPSLNGMGLDGPRCQQAGLKAQNLSLNTNIYFSAVSSDGNLYTNQGTGGSENVMQLQTRNEFWLNTSILGVGGKLLKKLKSVSTDGIPKANKSSGIEIRVVGEPMLDKASQRLQLQVDLVGTKEQTGTVDLNNRFAIDGKVYDKKFVAVSVETVGEMSVEQSLIKKGKLVLLVVPHAGDVYLDIITNLTMHSFGVDKVVQNKFLETLGDQFKKISDIL